jgi:uncharacterized membrane protein YccC
MSLSTFGVIVWSAALVINHDQPWWVLVIGGVVIGMYLGDVVQKAFQAWYRREDRR